MTTHREALVVGINRYPDLKDKNGKPQHLKKPAVDAEAIAQLLEKYGNFRVQRLPEVYLPEGKRGVDCDQRPPNLVEVPILEAAIAQLFNPSGKSIPDTALLFFAGHGLRKAQGDVTEGFLATSDVNPDKGKWGVSLRWLRELLQKSPVRQQIIWLDCCHSGELLNILDQANPGKDGNALDRCLIAACRGFEVSREQLQGEHGILTAALLQGLEPDRNVDGFVTNYKLADFINKEMSQESQRPIFHNSGNAIILTDKMLGRQRQVDANLVGKCPYKALEYFTQEDAVFFYGRTALTDELIDKVRTQNFIAVLGASGSGKSSVLRAGLLYQLKRGQKLSGSDRWTYYDPFTPGEHPLASLKNAIGKDAQEFSQFIQTSPSDLDPPHAPHPQRGPHAPPLTRGENSIKVPLFKGDLGGSPALTTSPTVETERVVLVIDQFEECFTMCQDSQEREEFFKYLLETLEQSENKLCLVLGMRADFLGKCAEYAQLAQKIDQHLVMVKPMNRQEIEEAITKPAELVNVQVEKALVTEMTRDVVESPGSLPLLQYTLTELWNQAQESPNRNRLTRECYHQLGGIEKTLPKRANQVYDSLNDEEKQVAKRIFLELTQLGETSDTRRRIRKQDLVNSQHSEELLDRTIEQLVQAKLIVPTPESQSQNAKPGVILDIVHEALIRHWQELRRWVEENQVALEKERRIEARAKEWERNGKTEDLGLLLQGATLIEAETYLKDYGNLGLLDGIAQEYIDLSQKVRAHILQREEERRHRELEAAKKLAKESEARRKAAQTRNIGLGISVLGLAVLAIFAFIQKKEAERQSVNGLIQASEASLITNRQIEALVAAVQAAKQLKDANLDRDPVLKLTVSATLQQALYNVQERNHFLGHNTYVYSVSFSPDGKTIVSGSQKGTIKLWSQDGKLLETLKLKIFREDITSLSISPNRQRIASSSDDGSIKLWSQDGKPIRTFKGHDSSVDSLSFSPDGKIIASGSDDGSIKLWSLDGKPLGTFTEDSHALASLSFSLDGKIIASGSWDGTIKLWSLDGKSLGTFTEDSNAVTSLSFSPDSKIIASGSDDGSIKLWSRLDKKSFQTIKGHSGDVNSLNFSPDGKTIASGSSDTTIKLWSLEGEKLKVLNGPDAHVRSVIFSRDGKKIAATGDQSIILWSREGQLLKTIKADSGVITSLSFSPDSNTIASASDQGMIKVWNLDGQLLKTSTEHKYEVPSLSFSSDGKNIVSGSWDNTIRLWSLDEPKSKILFTDDGAIFSVDFNPDGKTIIFGGQSNKVKLLSLEGKLLPNSFEHDGEIISASFSPDQKMIASSSQDGTVRLWSLDSQNSKILPGLSAVVRSVSFSPDGNIIAAGSLNGKINLWSRDGELLKTLNWLHPIDTISFSPDGKTLASGSYRGKVTLWNFDLDDLLVRGCDRLHDYLKNPNNGMSEEDVRRQTCDGIKP